MAVAEAWVSAERRSRYASPEGLGQAFNFDLLTVPWHPDKFRTIISKNVALATVSGSTPTWVLSNHDVVRHATRYGIQSPPGNEPESTDFSLGRGLSKPVDQERGDRRARAATMLLLALPGSTYLYQGEELGLFEVIDIPNELRQDPAASRTNGEGLGRDGCRVPIPWSTDEPSFGFSTAVAYLPQPAWFADHAVSKQLQDLHSVLQLYRTAIELRRVLQGPERMRWENSEPHVLHFTRPGGWQSLTNFGPEQIRVPPGEMLLSSQPMVGDMVPVDTTVWVLEAQ